MVCIYCGGKTQVTNSRPQLRNNQIWRRRLCAKCGANFTTHEAVYLPSVYLVAKNGRLEPFEPDKLYTEVLLALQDRKDCYTAAREVTASIIRQLSKGAENPAFDTRLISRTAAKILKRLDRQAFLRYAAEHPSLEY